MHYIGRMNPQEASIHRVLSQVLLAGRLAPGTQLVETRLAAAVGRVRLPDGSDRFVVDEPTLLAAWPIDPGQARRALASLLDDGLLRRTPHGRLTL